MRTEQEIKKELKIHEAWFKNPKNSNALEYDKDTTRNNIVLLKWVLGEE